MKIKNLASAALVVGMLLTGTAACSGGSSSSRSACQDRMEKDFQRGQDDPSWGGRKSTPSECRGISQKDLEAISGEILSKSLASATDAGSEIDPVESCEEAIDQKYRTTLDSGEDVNTIDTATLPECADVDEATRLETELKVSEKILAEMQ